MGTTRVEVVDPSERGGKGRKAFKRKETEEYRSYLHYLDCVSNESVNYLSILGKDVGRHLKDIV